MERRLSAPPQGEDEVGTLERQKACRRELIDPAIDEFHGRIIKLMGYGALVEFASVVDAVQCAAVIQRQMASYDQGVSSEFKVYRIWRADAMVPRSAPESCRSM
ncbi:class 3 adenylate cyclase [Sinorhizobium fredii]